ncbi:MAG: hypothetical protein SPL30_06670 [Succinivibrio sp.]|nr:hypothetical protein [Succinivibrio sp.]
MTEKYLLRKEDVANFLNISERTLIRVRSDKSLRFPKPMQLYGDSSTPLWRRSDVQAWADGLFEEKGA